MITWGYLDGNYLTLWFLGGWEYFMEFFRIIMQWPIPRFITAIIMIWLMFTQIGTWTGLKHILFLLYLPRFALYWTSISPLWYFRVINPDRELFQKLLNGVIYYLSWCFFFYLLADLRFTLVFFVLPLPEAITFFAGISYLWHSFASPENPNDFYVSSVTILNGRQNMWNEDYHVAHHSAPHLHWTQYAEHFQKLKSQFEEHTATIFSDTEEGELFFLIMTKNWDKMATKFVDLSGKMTLEEKKQLIIQRLSHTVAA